MPPFGLCQETTHLLTSLQGVVTLSGISVEHALSCEGSLQVYILPTIRINNGQYRGKLSYTEVLRAICAGFTKNTEPKVCMRVSVDDSCRDGSLGQTTCALRSGICH